MYFAEAIKFIEECHSHGTRLSLDNMRKILSLLGDPHKDIKFIHVAGTNGKGSTSSFINSILIAAGYKVGLFTSPHLHCYTDRIRINNINIEKEDFVNITSYLQNIISSFSPNEMPFPAMFDIMTLIAFIYYQYQSVDYVVLEVGLGGLFDATNVIEDSIASVITPIGIDHIDVLGNDLKEIAKHKAGIIKRNSIAVAHWQEDIVQEVIQHTAMDNNTQLYFLNKNDITLLEESYLGQAFHLNSNGYNLPNLKLQMIGHHQMYNASLAILTLLILQDKKLLYLPNDSIYRGVYSNIWAGRLELVQENPFIFIDGAHNLQGAEVLASAIERYFPNKSLNLVIGMLSNKDTIGVLNTLIPLCNRVIFTTPNNNPKAMEAEKLAQQVTYLGKEIKVAEKLEDAVVLALETSSADEVTIFTGSLYLIGDVRHILLNHVSNKVIAS